MSEAAYPYGVSNELVVLDGLRGVASYGVGGMRGDRGCQLFSTRMVLRNHPLFFCLGAEHPLGGTLTLIDQPVYHLYYRQARYGKIAANKNTPLF